MTDFETHKIHGYAVKDIKSAWEKIRLEEAEAGQMIRVLAPTQHKGVGEIIFIFDGENWVLKEVRL